MIARNEFPPRGRRRVARTGLMADGSLAVFAVATLVVSVLIARHHRPGIILDDWSVTWMVRFVPIYVAGVWVGLLGYRPLDRSRFRARLGVALNAAMLVPFNVIPIVWCFLK